MTSLIFSPAPRTDRRVVQPGENLFRYLDRSAMEYDGYLRDRIDEWYDRFARAVRTGFTVDERRSDWLGQFRTRQPEPFFWELLFHEVMLSCGYHVAVGETPDFELTERGGRQRTVSVEARAIEDVPPWPLVPRGQALPKTAPAFEHLLRNQLPEVLAGHVPSGIHMFLWDVWGDMRQRPNAADLRAWASGLDPSLPFQTAVYTSPGTSPFTARFAVYANYVASGTCASHYPLDARQSARNIRQSVVDKAKDYANLPPDHPLLLAIGYRGLDFALELETIAQALYGDDNETGAFAEARALGAPLAGIIWGQNVTPHGAPGAPGFDLWLPLGGQNPINPTHMRVITSRNYADPPPRGKTITQLLNLPPHQELRGISR